MTQSFRNRRQQAKQLNIDFSKQHKPPGRPRLTKAGIHQRLGSRPIELIGEVNGALSKTEWRCKVPECGCVWQARLSAVLRGTKCPSCARSRHSLCMRLSLDDVAAKLSGRFIQLMDHYQGINVKLRWKCTVLGCNREWQATPSAVFRGASCPRCSARSRVAMRLHGRLIELIGDIDANNKKTEWLCKVPDCGCRWMATPAHVLSDGSGCPSCALYGFNPKSPAILYYLRINRPDQSSLYKIGITNRTVKERFAGRDLELITIISEWHFDCGVNAQKRERELLYQNIADSYVGPPILRCGGNTELFNRDILGLDV